MEGIPDADRHMEQIRSIAGDDIQDMTPICFVPAMLTYRWHGTWVTSQVNVIGIDEKSQCRVSDFAKYLQHPENRRAMSFDLRQDGYDVHDHLAEGPTRPREAMQRGRLGASPRGGPGAGRRRKLMLRNRQYAASAGHSRRRSRHESPAIPGRGRTIGTRPNAGAACRSIPSQRGITAATPKTFDMAKEQMPRRGAGHRAGQLPHQGRRGALPRPAGRRREAQLSHRRRAAGHRQRQLHRRRFLREQDDRIRQPLRLHAHQGAARQRGMFDRDDGRGLRQRHRDQAAAGRRRRRRPRQAAGGLSAGLLSRRDLARQAGRLLGRRADGNRRSSTSCCF